MNIYEILLIGAMLFAGFGFLGSIIYGEYMLNKSDKKA